MNPKSMYGVYNSKFSADIILPVPERVWFLWSFAVSRNSFHYDSCTDTPISFLMHSFHDYIIYSYMDCLRTTHVPKLFFTNLFCSLGVQTLWSTDSEIPMIYVTDFHSSLLHSGIELDFSFGNLTTAIRLTCSSRLRSWL